MIIIISRRESRHTKWNQLGRKVVEMIIGHSLVQFVSMSECVWAETHRPFVWYPVCRCGKRSQGGASLLRARLWSCSAPSYAAGPADWSRPGDTAADWLSDDKASADWVNVGFLFGPDCQPSVVSLLSAIQSQQLPVWIRPPCVRPGSGVPFLPYWSSHFVLLSSISPPHPPHPHPLCPRRCQKNAWCFPASFAAPCQQAALMLCCWVMVLIAVHLNVRQTEEEKRKTE